MDEITYSTEHRPSSTEYIEFLRRSDLGRMYPKKDFAERISRLLDNASAAVTARHGPQLVGVCLGVSDFTYFLFVTDIGVARGYERRGIGRELLRRLHEAVGGPHDITIATWSNAAAKPFYEACGLTPKNGMVGKEASDWELFDISAMAEL
jgi:ribosomal protein S18 acetylase RimI-like enzyme